MVQEQCSYTRSSGEQLGQRFEGRMAAARRGSNGPYLIVDRQRLGRADWDESYLKRRWIFPAEGIPIADFNDLLARKHGKEQSMAD